MDTHIKALQLYFVALLTLLYGTPLLCSCQGTPPAISFDSAEAIDSVLLAPSHPSESPKCKASFHVVYLSDTSEQHEHAQAIEAINSYIAHTLLGCNETNTISDIANDALRQQIAEFSGELRNLYFDDLRNFREFVEGDEEATDSSDVRRYIIENYSYTYDISSEAHLGYADSIVCYTLTTTQYAGGAHPMQTARTLSVSLNDGHVIIPQDVFKSGTDSELIKRITMRLMKDNNVTTEAELIELGYLTTDISIPTNMLLDREHVVFHFNPYDIAPYSVGSIDVRFTYHELRDILNMY